MPLPMMVPTTTALAWLTPKSRERAGAGFVLVGCAVCVVMRWEQQTATIPDDKGDDAADQHMQVKGIEHGNASAAKGRRYYLTLARKLAL